MPAAPALPGTPAPADPDVPAVGAAEAPVPRTPAASVPRTARGRVKVKPGSILAARAASEYVYVGQDVRRILALGVALLGLVVLLWVVLVPFDLLGLY
jgi:hypothetical protein